MAEVSQGRMIAALVHELRPRATQFRKFPRIWVRSVSTATPAPQEKIDGAQPLQAWQTHHLDTGVSQMPARQRLSALREDLELKPFSSFLTDNYARQHNYLRISVTERCNLRCLYCMPEEGIQLTPQEKTLTTSEIVYLSELFVKQGVTKIRLTGGEPTVRKDIINLMQQIGSLRSLGLKELCITTNGISLHRKLDSMVESGLTAVNLSLDTLDPFQFTLMTRRNGHEAVMKSINRILEMNRLGAGIKLKINCVVMKGLNEREIIPFVELGREKDLEVRFIEYMPFEGNKWSKNKMLSFKDMLALIQSRYPDVHSVRDHPNDTSKTYKVPGFVGRMGFITSMTHNFCGSCNRLRITSDGNLKVCLFGDEEVSLRDILRDHNSGKPIDSDAMEALKQLESDRHQSLPGSTGTLGVSEREATLLDVIGMAVKNKKEKHAGIDLSGSKYDYKYQQQGRGIPLEHVRLSRPSLSGTGCQVPLHLLHDRGSKQHIRRFSDFSPRRICHSIAPAQSKNLKYTASARRWSHAQPGVISKQETSIDVPRLSHLTAAGAAHMISISHKLPTLRRATAKATLLFSDATTYSALTAAGNKKGDAIAVARIAAIQAAKRTPDLIPLAHPSLGITGINVDIEPFHGNVKRIETATHSESINTDASETSRLNSCFGGVDVIATVACEGKTGVEMEAMTAATMGAMTLYDMLKGVDKGMMITGCRVVRKEGGKSGGWEWNEETNQLVKQP